MPTAPAGHARPKLTRAEQRYNYALAIGAVAVVVILIVISPHVTMGEGKDRFEVPVLPAALLVGAFLVGLGQMVVGINRRRAYLRSLREDGGGGEGVV
ncbi:MAG TPA: hypothetical protein VIN56_01030 [Candidatus Dormibacteraeota bacterium]|jgi:peptidoglycan/LPS O-acetylase OafA/YrhL